MKKSDGLDLDRIAFIGRTAAEYMMMFGLDKSVLEKGSVLDCPAGPSSFTAEVHRAGFNVTACDILYDVPSKMLVSKGSEDISYVFERFDEVSHLYAWGYYKNKDTVISLRKKALELFAEDFIKGSNEGRYRYAELPRLPFSDNSFSLVLSSHFLFLYGDRLDLDFHKACLKEFLRVCSREVRIFPLTGLDAKPYPPLPDVLDFLRSEDVGAEIREMPFEFQIGANKMLKLTLR
jgi:hypothetical protein